MTKFKNKLSTWPTLLLLSGGLCFIGGALYLLMTSPNDLVPLTNDSQEKPAASREPNVEVITKDESRTEVVEQEDPFEVPVENELSIRGLPSTAEPTVPSASSKPPPAYAGAEAMTALYDTPPPWDSTVKKIPQSRAAIQAFASAMSDYVFAPYVVEDQQFGYTIWNGDEAALKAIGLQPGDTILAINGVTLTSLPALETVQDILGRATILQINALRDSRHLVLNYAVEPS